MQRKIISAGHICIDFTPEFSCENQKRPEDLLVPGKLINVGKAQFHPGGTVSNTGLALLFFGMETFLMGKIGDDAFGMMLMKELKKRGVGEGMLLSPGQETSYSVVLAIPGVDRMFLHHSGANDTFTADDINYDRCREASLFHFGYPPIMAEMYRNGGRELTKMFSRVKECGCLTSLDMAAIDEHSEAAKADWTQILKNTLPFVDFFLPSIEELLFALDRNRYYELSKLADGRDMTEVIPVREEAALLAQQLLEMGCKLAIVKCGGAGFYYKTASVKAFEELQLQSGIDFSTFADQEGFEPSFIPDAVISGTGAGDTTIAAFLAALLNGYPFKKCLSLASAAGACCVSAPDALSGLLTFEQMEEKIAAGWEKNSCPG